MCRKSPIQSGASLGKETLVASQCGQQWPGQTNGLISMHKPEVLWLGAKDETSKSVLNDPEMTMHPDNDLCLDQTGFVTGARRASDQKYQSEFPPGRYTIHP